MHYATQTRSMRWREVVARDLKLIFAIAVVMVGAAAVNIVSYRSDMEIGEIVNRPRKSNYSIALEDNKATGINDRGEIVWQISADLVTVSAREDEYEFHNAVAHFFDANGPNLRVEVGRIVYYDSSKNLDLLDGIRILTRDNMMIETDRVYWVHYASQFVFPERVTLVTKDGNWVASDYMQGDKDLRQMSFVGNCQVKVSELKDTMFIQERKLTTADLKLQDFKDVFIHADMVIYDKDLEVLVAVSDFSDKVYEVKPPFVTNPITGERLAPPVKDEPTQLYFKKGEIEIWANHVEVHMKDSWAKCYGNVAMRVNPSKLKDDDDPALKAMRKRTTVIKADDIEYFWDIDYARTYGRSFVMQDDRRAGAWGITYFGKYMDPDTGARRKVVFLDDDIFIYQKSGQWMKDDGVIKDFKNPDVEKMLYDEIKLTANRSVIFLDSNDIYSEGKVRIRQPDKGAECGESFYDDQKKKFTCQGGVEYWNKKDEHFTGEQIIFFSDKDDIEVNGRSDAMIRIPEKYISEFDKVDRKLKERGAKGTTVEEDEKHRQSELERFRRENPPWEFLPAWQDVVVKETPGKGLVAIQEPPAPEVDIEAFDWLAELAGSDLTKPPWEGERKTSIGKLIDLFTGGRGIPGMSRGNGEGSEADGASGRLLPPEGLPIPPPQITGLAGDDAVRAAMGESGKGRDSGGTVKAPAGGEFLPPPGAPNGSSEITSSVSVENFEIIIPPKNEGQNAETTAPKAPVMRDIIDQEVDTKDTDGKDDKDDQKGDEGNAIVVRPPKEDGD